MPARRPLMFRRALAVALACLTAVIVYMLLPSAELRSLWLVLGQVGSVAAILYGTHRHRPSARLPWLLIAAGMVVNIVAGQLWTPEGALHGGALQTASEACYVATYALWSIGIALFVRHSAPWTGPEEGIDTALIAVASLSLLWVGALDQSWDNRAVTGVAAASAVAYPIMDLLLFTVVGRLLVEGRHARTSGVLLMGALTASFIADSAYAFFSFEGTYVTGSRIDAIWLVAALLLGASALQPDMVELTERRPPTGPRLTLSQLAAVTGAALSVPILVTLAVRSPNGVDVPIVIFGTATLVLLLVARMAAFLRRMDVALTQLRRNEMVLEQTLAHLSDARDVRTALLHQAVRSAEHERRRIAADIHDGPIQGLTALGYRLEHARIVLERSAPAAHGLLSPLQDQLAERVQELRRLMSDLRPPALDERGLQAAITDLARSFEANTGVACRGTVELDGRLDESIEVVVYRLVQESLANVARHAQATRVDVEVRQVAERLALVVRDDGTGFDELQTNEYLASGHFGLSIMRERVEMAGGTCTVRSRVGSGTVVEALIPLVAEGAVAP